jgi:HK97 family phage prohead protease
MEILNFPLEIKTLDETGTFEGLAAVVGNVDHGGDKIEPGAFTKTVQERPKVPILWQHDSKQPIGVGELGVNADGNLAVKGKLTMAVQRAQEAHALMSDGALGGLSIGYAAVKKTYKGGVRLLKELAIHEFSPVTFPMNELATIGGVKGFIDSLAGSTATPAEIRAAVSALQTLLYALEPDRCCCSDTTLCACGAVDEGAEPDLLHSLQSAMTTLKER